MAPDPRSAGRNAGGARRLRVLLGAALLGVLLITGLAVGSVAGVAGAGAFSSAAVVLLGFAVARAQPVLAPPPLPPGRTCTCCTGTQHDPVQVV